MTNLIPYTGFSLISTCDDGRQYRNSQDLARTDGNKIKFESTFSPAQNYLTNDNNDVIWNNALPKEQKYKNIEDYLNSKEVKAVKLASGEDAINKYNLMGFENQLINAMPDELKPKYKKLNDNCNTSTQWKKDNHFPELKEKSIQKITSNGKYSKNIKEQILDKIKNSIQLATGIGSIKEIKKDVEEVLGNHIYGEVSSPKKYNDVYKIVDTAKNTVAKQNPNIDFSKVSNIKWSKINNLSGEVVRFSDDKQNYIVYKDANHPDKYRVMIQTRYR